MRLTLLLAALAAPPAYAAESLNVLAERADVIAVVQLGVTRYEYQRSIPMKGMAQLEVLIPYKGAEPNQILEVHAEGFAAEACYYPDGIEDSQRYLVFLNTRAKGGLEGSKPYCQLPVLVADDAQYALRYPVEGVHIPDTSIVREFNFNDINAYVDPYYLTEPELAKVKEGQRLREMEDGRLRYLDGIPLPEVRQLMFPDSQDR